MDNILKHGGYLSPQSKKRLGMESSFDALETIDVATDFDYMFPDLANDTDSKLPSNDTETTINNLKALAEALIDSPPDASLKDSTIPTIYTYWGQFIDHDVTANTDRTAGDSDITKDKFLPLSPNDVTSKLKNLRRPQLDLDSVYGDGPDGDAHLFYDGAKFRLGKVRLNPPAPAPSEIPGDQVHAGNDVERDLPRIGALIDANLATPEDFEETLRNSPQFRNLAWIGDMRNDENTIVAQFHQAVLRFHNNVVDRLTETTSLEGNDLFREARKLTTWHYQWLVINDYLRTITYPGVVDDILCRGRQFYDPDNSREFMPLEHSVAAFRFGHTMVRDSYDFNRNFGKESKVIPSAGFNFLFQFTGGGGFDGNEILPFNWVIEFDRFTNHGSSDSKHFARKVDTLLAPELGNLPIEEKRDEDGNIIVQTPRVVNILKHLATRNLLRGYQLNMPTGQAIAKRMDIKPLTEKEFRTSNSQAIDDALDAGGFIKKTPLWYYILKESEVRAHGNCLGEVGSRIVAETFVGLIEKDPSSFRNKDWHHNWHPGLGIRLNDGKCITTITDFIKFANLAVEPLAP